MTTLTLYPTPGGYGTVNSEASSWADARAATTGTVDAGSGSFPYIESYNSGTTYKIWRYFCPIDTSSIPTNAVIDSAQLILSCFTVTNTDADGNDFVSVIQTTQSNSASLAAGDFDNVGTTEGSSRVDVDDIATWEENSWTLNATGIGWINKSGVTYFGFRSGHDLLNNAISSNTQVSLRVFQSDNSLPRLVVTYHLPATGGGVTIF